MLQVLYGGGQESLAKEVCRTVKRFQKENPAGGFFRFDNDGFEPARFEELLSAQGLFAKKALVVSRDLLAEAGSREFVLERLAEAVASENLFVFWERKLDAKTVRLVTRAGGKAEEFKVKTKVEEKQPLNLFLLTDALGERNRRKLWLLYQAALAQGFATEDIFWKFVWQVKTLLLLKQDARLAHYKPWFVGKLKRQSANYELIDLQNLSARLVTLWHETKTEVGRDLGLSLERLILSL